MVFVKHFNLERVKESQVFLKNEIFFLVHNSGFILKSQFEKKRKFNHIRFFPFLTFYLSLSPLCGKRKKALYSPYSNLHIHL